MLTFGSVFAYTKVINKVDNLYQDRENPKSVTEAIKTIKLTLADDPRNYELLWRLSRFYMWLGNLSTDKDERLNKYEQGKLYAESALMANEDGIEAHFYRGVFLGKISAEDGMFKHLALVEPIRLEMEIVLEYAPEHTGAHHMLGELYRKTPGWPLSIGNNEKSLEEALLAVEYGPDYTYTHLGLAETYIAMGKKERAIEELQKVIDMLLPIDYIPEGRKDKVRASELLKKLKK